MFSGNDRVRNEHWCMNGWKVGSEDCPFQRTLNRNEAICLPSRMHRVCEYATAYCVCALCLPTYNAFTRTLHQPVRHQACALWRNQQKSKQRQQRRTNERAKKNCAQNENEIYLAGWWWWWCDERCASAWACAACKRTHTAHSPHRMLDGVTYRSWRMSNPV